MQIVWSAHQKNLELGIEHEFRENNKWADQLAGGDATGFDPNKRLTPTMDAPKWDLLALFTSESVLKSALSSQKRRGKKKKGAQT